MRGANVDLIACSQSFARVYFDNLALISLRRHIANVREEIVDNCLHEDELRATERGSQIIDGHGHVIGAVFLQVLARTQVLEGYIAGLTDVFAVEVRLFPHNGREGKTATEVVFDIQVVNAAVRSISKVL